METKVILSLSEEDGRKASHGLHFIGSMAADTGYLLEQIINAACENPVEVKLSYVALIQEAINEYLAEKRYEEEERRKVAQHG